MRRRSSVKSNKKWTAYRNRAAAYPQHPQRVALFSEKILEINSCE